MKIKSLTYTSRAIPGLSDQDVNDIHQDARHLNALDGITGLLAFDGCRFLQLVEGVEVAIDDLIERLRGDTRHRDICIRDERYIEDRSFPDWSMGLINVSTGYMNARAELADALPAGVKGPIRELLNEMAGRVAQED